ncbi:MAG TPA: Mur ligase domain-containing protein [Candidatus Paceibacterota bacterium]|nr:Mur ligase domain-containing protein [Candidatus Paceibacterota bacterium]HMO83254.1 Mur ligase domain-containing protein [Candidatus Paceibacterota bacterium]
MKLINKVTKIPENTARVHFIGIGGIGMSALVRFFVHEGKQVSGSDRAQSIITDKLAKLGVELFFEQQASNITPDIDMVVYTEAMPEDHVEMVAARKLGVPMLNYFSALGLVANEYYLIAVSGTHGKTTTTAMLADVFEEAGLDPTVIVGSLRSKTGSNFRAGKSKYAIVEACEYKRDFLYLKPDILVITNLEFEHVDYYQDLRDVQAAFRELALAVPEDGFVVADTSQANIKPVLEGVKATIVDYRPHIDLGLALKQPGMHNLLNAAVAKAVGQVVGIDTKEASKTLENFAGTWRRFEYKGDFVNDFGKVPVYDDYGHHPTEIRATILGAREKYKDNHLTVVFQSHLYTRTKEFFAEFVSALAKADRVIMLPIYRARNEDTSGVNSEALVEAINRAGTEALYFETHSAAALKVKEITPKDGVVLVMGAGDVTEVATLLVS